MLTKNGKKNALQSRGAIFDFTNLYLLCTEIHRSALLIELAPEVLERIEAEPR